MEYANDYSAIICPHCQHKNRMEPDEVPWMDEETQDKTCSNCDKDFELRANVTVSWTTHKDEDDE